MKKLIQLLYTNIPHHCSKESFNNSSEFTLRTKQLFGALLFRWVKITSHITIPKEPYWKGNKQSTKILEDNHMLNLQHLYMISNKLLTGVLLEI